MINLDISGEPLQYQGDDLSKAYIGPSGEKMKRIKCWLIGGHQWILVSHKGGSFMQRCDYCGHEEPAILEEAKGFGSDTGGMEE